MGKFAVSYCKAAAKISEWSGKGVALLLIPLTLILLYEVTLRYGFNNPTRWAHETSIYLFGIIAAISGAYVLLHKAHVNLDLLYSRVSARKQAILDLITAPIFLFIMVLLIWKGAAFALTSWSLLERSSTVWNPPLYPIKTAIPIAGLLIFLQVIAKLIRDLIFVNRGKELD